MNFKKLPKQEDVQTFPLGDLDVSLITLTDENRGHILEVVLEMYCNEPCRICGINIQNTDFRHYGGAGVVYAGYSLNDTARSAHKICWENRPDKSEWAYPVDAED